MTEDDEDCHKNVMQHTRIQAKNAKLNPLIANACAHVIGQQCSKEVGKCNGSKMRPINKVEYSF